MKKYKEFIGESKKDLTLTWFDAIHNNNIKTIRTLINSGIDVNIKNFQNNTALYIICVQAHENLKIMQMLIDAGADVNFINSFGKTPLIISSYKPVYINHVKLLIKSGANLFLKDLNGNTFYDIIDNINKMNLKNDLKFQRSLSDDILLNLDKLGLVNDEIKKEHPELFKAAKWGLVGETKKDLTDVELRNEIRSAIIFREEDKVKSLLKKGVDVNTWFSNNNDSLLTRVAAFRNFKIMKLLLQQPNIDVNHLNSYNNNALLISVDTNEGLIYYDCIKILLEHPDIDITVKNVYDKNFLDILIDEREETFLYDYGLQKKILDNKRDDILLFFDKYGVLHPKIKEEHPELFKAKDWGLI